MYNERSLSLFACLVSLMENFHIFDTGDLAALFQAYLGLECTAPPGPQACVPPRAYLSV